MKHTSLAAFLLVAGFSRFAQAAVEVTVFRIEESRVIELADDKVSRPGPKMSLLLSLRGPEAESSVRYGDLKLEEAVDDQGASLVPAKDSFDDPAKFKDFANSFFRNSKFGFGAKARPADPQVELALAMPKRAATKIARLRGTLTLSDQGTLQTVELANLKEAGKKALPFPPDAHLSVTAEVAPGEAVRSIGIQISGDERILESIDLLDASGHKVSSGMSKWRANGGPAHNTIQLEKPLDNSMKLVASFSLNRKLITVPFDLKDIPLP